jgi:hypothetical protein
VFDKLGRRRTGLELNCGRFRKSKKTVTRDPRLPEILRPPSGLMRKRRPAYVWITLALLLGAFIALLVIVFASG